MPANTPTEPNESSTSSPLWGTTSFEPGSDVGLVAQHTVGLIERDNPSTRDRLWRLVADESPLDDILDELSSTGLKALPDFGIAQVEGEAVRLVARGRAMITVELASGGTHAVDPSGVRTWIEEVVADVVGLTIALSPVDGDEPTLLSSEGFAVLAGSVPARSLTRRYDVADRHADDAMGGWTTAGSEAGVAPDRAADSDREMIDSTEEDDGLSSAASSTVASTSAGVPEAGGPPPSPEPVVSPSPEPVESPSPEPVVSPSPERVESPSPEPVVSPSPERVESAPADPQPADPQPADPQPADPQPAPPAAAAGPSGPPPSGSGAGGQGPEATVVVGFDDGPSRGPVSSIFDEDDAAAPPPFALAGETAQFSEDDFTPDSDDSAGTGSPTVYGVLAFSNGDRINVDRSVLIGRNPKVAGAVAGGMPHIMKFEGPGQGLSRTHAEVRVENGEMLLEDLQSTNGTEIQLPGQQRRRLRSGEPVVVVPGTLVDFGDELHCIVETAI
jgi:hypothetical protein